MHVLTLQVMFVVLCSGSTQPAARPPAGAVALPPLAVPERPRQPEPPCHLRYGCSGRARMANNDDGGDYVLGRDESESEIEKEESTPQGKACWLPWLVNSMASARSSQGEHNSKTFWLLLWCPIAHAQFGRRRRHAHHRDHSSASSSPDDGERVSPNDDSPECGSLCEDEV